MSLDTDISYIYDKILSKALYDKTIQKHIIRKEDYPYLELSRNQMLLLKQICERSGIILEEPDMKLPSVEDEELFKEYNEIQEQLKNNPQAKDYLETRRIQIRNQIASANLKLVRTILNRRIDGIHQMEDKEDIYQLGYELLLEFIDKHNITQKGYFTKFISSNLVNYVIRRIPNMRNNIGFSTNEKISKIRKTQNNPNRERQFLSVEEIQELFDIPTHEAKALLNLDALLCAISIDEEIKKLNQKADSYTLSSPLYDSSFEENLIKNSARETIIKIIYTLPVQQRKILMLSYGFKDNYCYNDVEIAKILGISRVAVGLIKVEALANLRLSIRSNYLKDFYIFDHPYQDFAENHMTKKQKSVLEEVLIGYIPHEELLEYLNNIPERERTVLILYLGLKDGIKYNLISISKIIGISTSSVYNLKEQGFTNLQNHIIKIKFQKYITNREYLDYLIKTYVINRDVKSKH